jgi:hypothetical protein
VIAILNQAALGGPLNAVDPAATAQLVLAANIASAAIMQHSPIHNNVERGAYSFYFDFNAYTAVSPHWFHVEAAVAGELVRFMPLTFMQPDNLAHIIGPNECAYVLLTMRRDSLGIRAL